MKNMRMTAIMCGLLAIGPAAADATTTTYCLTSGSFSACASATFSLSQGGTQLTVTVRNLGVGVDQANTSYSLTAVAFFHKPAGEIGPALTLISNDAGWTEGYNYGIQEPLQG
jgi:hypothetical protein